MYGRPVSDARVALRPFISFERLQEAVMPELVVLPTDNRHRQPIPPEMKLIVEKYGKPHASSTGRPYDLFLDVQYGYDLTHGEGFSELRIEPFGVLRYDTQNRIALDAGGRISWGTGGAASEGGEPSQLLLEGPEGDDAAMPPSDFWRARLSQSAWKAWLGDAHESFARLLAQVLPEALADTGRSTEYWIRFVDPADYYHLFLRQCQLIAETNGGSFDPAAKLGKWQDWWNSAGGYRSVRLQRDWYAENGPGAGETQAHYAATVQEFERLIADNLRALGRLRDKLAA